jgi:hypothetical protein
MSETLRVNSIVPRGHTSVPSSFSQTLKKDENNGPQEEDESQLKRRKKRQHKKSRLGCYNCKRVRIKVGLKYLWLFTRQLRDITV